MGVAMAEPLAVSFGGLLRQLRARAGLTQEELAEASGLSPRSVSDLERGINATARRETARLLADTLSLAGAARSAFEAAARGRGVEGGVLMPAVPDDGAAAATRTLPLHIASFTGREPELGMLVGAVARAADSGEAAGIYVIGGMAGVGKTTFAVRAASRLAAWFPDGQLFLPLHGYSPGQHPVDPAHALASLLRTAGIRPAGSRRGWRNGPGCGGTTRPGSGCCSCSMTRPGTSRSGRCCPAPARAWC